MSTSDPTTDLTVGAHEGPSLNAKKHGAYVEHEIAPLRENHLARLRQRFPEADDQLLYIQAGRAAQLDLIGSWLGQRLGVNSVIRNRRTTTVWPAREYEAKLASAYERQLERLEAQAREAGSKPAQTLAEIAAEYGGDE